MQERFSQFVVEFVFANLVVQLLNLGLEFVNQLAVLGVRLVGGHGEVFLYQFVHRSFWSSSLSGRNHFLIFFAPVFVGFRSMSAQTLRLVELLAAVLALIFASLSVIG